MFILENRNYNKAFDSLLQVVTTNLNQDKTSF